MGLHKQSNMSICSLVPRTRMEGVTSQRGRRWEPFCNWTTGVPVNGGSSVSYLARILAFPRFVPCLIGLETEGLLDYEGRAGIVSIVRWNLCPVIFGVENPPKIKKFICFSEQLFRWVPDSCHREEGKSSRELFEKVRVNVVFFGSSLFGWVFGPLNISPVPSCGCQGNRPGMPWMNFQNSLDQSLSSPSSVL